MANFTLLYSSKGPSLKAGSWPTASVSVRNHFSSVLNKAHYLLCTVQPYWILSRFPCFQHCGSWSSLTGMWQMWSKLSSSGVSVLQLISTRQFVLCSQCILYWRWSPVSVPADACSISLQEHCTIELQEAQQFVWAHTLQRTLLNLAIFALFPCHKYSDAGWPPCWSTPKDISK